MHRYEMATPRLAAGTAALALTAVTLAVMVIIPATMEAGAQDLVVASAAAPRAIPGAAQATVDEHEPADQCAGAPADAQARP
jgi:hypothetical protein